MILTYRYRLKDRSAAKLLRQHAFACNQVWNWCCGQQRDVEARYRAGAPKRKWASRFDLSRQCKGVGRDLGIHQQTIQAICHQFTVSRDKQRNAPRFRASGGSRRALGWIPFQQQSRQVEGNSITYLGHVFRWFGNARRPLPETAKGGAFVEDARGRWYVCFVVDVEGLPTGNGRVGIDLGLKTLATCSDGAAVDAIRPIRSYAQRLATAQRSKNKRRVKALHAKIANIRCDHIHKSTSQIAKCNGLIAVGNVNSCKLAKTKMAKSVYDASWSMFRNQLRYKASRHGAEYMDIDERFTTVTCSSCSARSGPQGQKGLRIREWDCSECGVSHDRDVNSARNILALALSAQRPVGESREGARHG